MLFNSFEFLLFFPIVTILYFLLPYRFRWFHLLAASCLFYMAFVPVYILILLFTVVIDYIAGIMIENSEGQRRRLYLTMSIVANIGVLAFFKYYNFFTENVNLLFSSIYVAASLPFLKIVLPIGLSFHTFQAMSYTIEVYRGNQKAEKHFGIYALYVMFYPQLVAGPIERPQNVLHQFHEKRDFNYSNAVSGLQLILWGIFKKVVIADRIAQLIDPIYNSPQNYSSFAILLAVILFAWEIFCDFSGYSDIALGSARVMGYELMVNFDHPFRSKSISEFWRRWHISLSTWFNDYLFNPLATKWRYWGNSGIILALLITFFLSGFWHGAGWKFVIFGMIHGVAIAYEYLTRKQRKKLFSKLPEKVNNVVSKWLMLAYVIFSWVFFRANNVADACYILKRLPGGFTDIYHTILNRKLFARVYLKNISIIELYTSIFFIILLELIHYIQGREQVDKFIGHKPAATRWVTYCCCILVILLWGVFDNKQFIYFQF